MAGMDANYQISLLEVERGRQRIALSPGLHVICGTRFLDVSGILLEKMCTLRKKLIRSWPSTQMYLGVVGLATHMTEMIESQILCATTTEM